MSAWLAGILDGEGCVSSQLRGNALSIQLRINNTCTRMLKKVEEILQSLEVKFTSRVCKEYKNRRPLYSVTVCNLPDICKVLSECMPDLTTKYDQAVLVLAYNDSKIDKKELHKGLKEMKQFARLR